MGQEANQNTQRLVAAAKAGDKAAEEELFRTYSDRVLHLVRLRMGGELRTKMQSMDIVQDALMGAFRDMKDFVYRNDGDFLRWISRIAENKIRDHIDGLHAQKRDVRKEKPLMDGSSDGPAGAGPEPVHSATPSVIMSRAEELARLEKAMDELKPEYREVVILTRIEGLSRNEVAARLGKTPGAVRMLLVRAIKQMSSSFEATDGRK